MQAEGGGSTLNPPYCAPQRGSAEPKINSRGGRPPPTLGNRYRWDQRARARLGPEAWAVAA